MEQKQDEQLRILELRARLMDEFDKGRKETKEQTSVAISAEQIMAIKKRQMLTEIKLFDLRDALVEEMARIKKEMTEVHEKTERTEEQYRESFGLSSLCKREIERREALLAKVLAHKCVGEDSASVEDVGSQN